MFELKKDEIQAKEQAKNAVQNFKKELGQIEQKLEKLLNVYLTEVITTEEYTARKQKLLTQKIELEEKIRDFEQKDCLGSNQLVSSFYRLIKPKN